MSIIDGLAYMMNYHSCFGYFLKVYRHPCCQLKSRSL